MAYKNLNLLFMILILLVVNGLNGQKFIPGPREGHTATLLGGKIYYIGGLATNHDLIAGNIFYIDEKFTWIDLKGKVVNFPPTLRHTPDIGGVNQDLIFIIGGRQLRTTTSLVYRFDTKTNAMTVPLIQGITPPRREEISSVSYEGKIYIFSGVAPDINFNAIFFNNFDILDTITMNWQVGSLINAPLPRFGYTATLVNGVIYYIGGIQQSGTTSQNYVLMSDIYRYDIIGNIWTFKIATAAKTLPEDRFGHSAVLVDGKICIYGGTYFPKGAIRALPSTEQIAMLDTITLVWSIPQLQDPNIPNLVRHTATIIDKFMLIAFGNITNLPGGSVYNDKFYLFDFGGPNIKWSGFTALEIGNAKAPQSPTTSPNSPITPNTATSTGTISSDKTKTLIVGLSVGLLAVGLAVIVGFALVYKRMKKIENVSVEGGSGHPAHRGVPGAFDGQIPPDDNLHYSTYSPQFAPQYQYSNSQQDPYSRTSTLIQSPGYFPSQEFSILPSPPQEKFSKRSSNSYLGSETHPSNSYPGSETHPSNYYPGSEALPSNYFPGSETPPPPPSPKAPQSAFNVHGTNNEAYD